ncbi:MAG: hypothetical protein HYV53_00930 [Parcubacteria group bacterium]|nr:hypothetical protein [Parcubacteria group bacterium]
MGKKKNKNNKAEKKTVQQSVDELRKSLRRFKANMEVINDELLKPVEEKIESELEKVGDKLKKLDDKFAPGTEIHRKTTEFKLWAKKLQDKELAKYHRRSKNWFEKHVFWILFILFWALIIIISYLYDKGVIK